MRVLKNARLAAHVRTLLLDIGFFDDKDEVSYDREF